MKKFNYIILMFAMMFTCLINVYATNYGSNESARLACQADASQPKDLSTVTGKVTVRSCVQLVCSQDGNGNGSWSYRYVRAVAATGVCANGNRTPYQTKTYGYSRSGSCNPRGDTWAYTNMDITYDCTRTSNGQPYQQTTKSTSTKKTNPTAKPTSPTPKPSSTKRTGDTTTSVIGGNDTTSTQGVTSPGENTTSSTTTTRAISSDASIKRITINDKFDLGYSSDRNEYSIKVPYSMSEFIVYVETNDSSAYVDVNGNGNITSEGGVITIKVTSSDLSNSTDVKINVTRYTKEEGDCSLAQLLVKDYNIDFSSSKEQYVIKLQNNDRQLEIEAIPTNPSSIFTISGNEKLRNNSKVEILVEAVDGTTCTYMITTKKSSKLLLYLFLIVVIGVGLFFGIKKIIELSTKGKNKYRYE